jgi:hypothetical protein
VSWTPEAAGSWVTNATAEPLTRYGDECLVCHVNRGLHWAIMPLVLDNGEIVYGHQYAICDTCHQAQHLRRYGVERGPSYHKDFPVVGKADLLAIIQKASLPEELRQHARDLLEQLEPPPPIGLDSPMSSVIDGASFGELVAAVAESAGQPVEVVRE